MPENNNLQDTTRRGVVYLNPRTRQPYAEQEAQWIGYWVAMGFDPTKPEFNNVMEMAELTPELTWYQIEVWEN